MSHEEYSKWNRRWASRNYVIDIEPRVTLSEWIETIPAGRVLDIACGDGRNSLYLAQNGFVVDAIDISIAALKLVQRGAMDRGTHVNLILADLDNYVVPQATYDLITCSFYLNRELIPSIKNGVKPGGFVIYEQHYVPYGTGLDDGNIGFKLRAGELPVLFQDMEIKFFSEGNLQELDDEASIARLVARRPTS